MKRVRESGLDVVRCFATVSLPVLHSFMYAGLYSVSPNECFAISYVLMFSLRWIVYCVVPLFMMLTGYLNESTKIDVSYLKKILPIVCSYIVISIFAYIIVMDNTNIKLVDIIIALLNYTADPYSWYVEMYIGLFLLAPFLNTLWRVLERNHRMHLMILMITMSFATQINNLLLYQGNYVKLVPAWWAGIYPLGYFFIGKWIKEYRPHPQKIKLIVVGGYGNSRRHNNMVAFY